MPEKQQFTFKVEEAIWGHRLHNEQTAPMIALEFLNVIANISFKEYRSLPDSASLKYRSPRRFGLRTLVFNNPFIDLIDINTQLPWKTWEQAFLGKDPNTSKSGSSLPKSNYELLNDFHLISGNDWSASYLTKLFNYGRLGDDSESFESFTKIIKLIRSSGFNTDSNKRWTSLFVFPWGRNCLYAETDPSGSPDKRFFGRSGELLYVLLSRADHIDELETLIKERFLDTHHPLDLVCKALEGPYQDRTLENSGCYGPDCWTDMTYIRSNLLCDDMINLLKVSLPSEDLFFHFSRLITLHLICYFYERAYEAQDTEFYQSSQPTLSSLRLQLFFPCEILASRTNAIRRLSQSAYETHKNSPVLGIKTYIDEKFHQIDQQVNDKLKQSRRVHGDSNEYEDIFREFFLTAFNVQGKKRDDFKANSSKNLQRSFFDQVMIRHSKHWGKVAHDFGRSIGFSSIVGTNRYRYCPQDDLLVTLILVNITDKRMLLEDLLHLFFEKYHLIIGFPEIPLKEKVDDSEWTNNVERLKQRLKKLGLLESLSDGFDFVMNNFAPQSNTKI